MEYIKLGRTGLDVSRICLGCMSYGGGNRGNHAWSLREEESRPFIKRALEAGINFFDTANRYSLGSSEEIRMQNLVNLLYREGGAGDAAAVRGGRYGRHSMEPASPREADPRLELHQHSD